MNFSSKITLWYNQNKRDLPWRVTTDPYRIWLSEIILQQTRIDQGMAYYHRFVDSFPTIGSLAAAGEEKVLKLWQGLGYYTRARNLYRTACIVTGKYGGVFPDDWETVRGLPGIGDYTAAAILSLAYRKPFAVVDGNVFRVLTRLFGIELSIDSTPGKKLISQKAIELMDTGDPGTYNQAVMEFGALYCKPQNPDCPNCIFRADCFAFQKQEVEKFPVRKVKPVQRSRYFYYFLFNFRSNHSAKILINKRGGDDIWKNLYDFPLIETHRQIPIKRLREKGFNDFSLKNIPMKIMGTKYKHILSHQVIQARFISLDLPEETLAEVQKNLRIENLIPIDARDLVHYPIPRLIEKFLEENRLTGSSGE